MLCLVLNNFLQILLQFLIMIKSKFCKLLSDVAGVAILSSDNPLDIHPKYFPIEPVNILK